MSGVPAVLALADGTIFRGQSIGAKGNTTGEVVFNTALTGYQEILTDPSYARQIVTLTCPHIGNTGTNDVDVEAGGEVGSAAAGTAHAVGAGVCRYRAAGGDDGEATHSRIIPNRGGEAAPNQAGR